MLTQPRIRAEGHATHEVFNQPTPLEGYDAFGADMALVEGMRREGAAWAEDDLRAFGRLAGSAEAIAWGFEANEHPPELHTHDRYGHRIDEVRFHPAWHAPDAHGCRPGAARRAVARAEAGGACGTCRRVLRLVAGGGRAWLPDLDDVRQHPGIAHGASGGRRMGTRHHVAGV